MTGNVFNRPGVTDEFLLEAGCQHVGADECVKLYGFRAEGIAIPFRHADGSPITDNDRPFTRVRLYRGTDEQKYHQRAGSSVHIYVPQTFVQSPKGSRLILVEGEFKSLALAEAGHAALGLCGFNGAVRTILGTNGAHDHALNDELIGLLRTHEPVQIVFLGDADVVLNARFSVEAAKLRRLLFASRQFPFIERFTVTQLPLAGPKGVDDLREEKGEAFSKSFEAILSKSYAVPPKANATEIFVGLLKREKPAVKRLLSKKDHEASRARVRLLQSAAQLWNETGARLELKPLLADVLGIKPNEVAGLVKDASVKKHEIESSKSAASDNAQGSAVEFAEVDPWPEPVNGAEVLNEIAATFTRYLALPPGGADGMALWTAHTHGFEAFVHTPRLNLYSPEKGCGKTTALDVLASMTPRPLRTESITPAVLFRLVEMHRPILLLDEVDAYLNEAEELRGLLNAGHKRGAKAYRCEGEDNAVRGFSAFAPAALAGIGALPGTLHDRSIVIRLVRAKPGEVTARFDSRRTEKEAALCRKLARWTADNLTKLKSCDPELPGSAFNRLADNWRPLFAVAEAAGKNWQQRAAAAFAALTTGDDADAHGIGAALLDDMRAIFTAAGGDRLASARIVEELTGMDGKPWPEFGKGGKPISVNQLARLLGRFNIRSRTIRIGQETAKGYLVAEFQDAFARYLPPSPSSKGNTVTSPENIADSLPSELSHDDNALPSEIATFPNDGAGCDGVTDPKAATPDAEENVMLL